MIESEHILRDSLQNGINLFLGSGFSVLAKNKDGFALPTGKGLLNEIQDNFEKVASFPDLSKACSVLESTIDRNNFHTFLINRFSVTQYHDLYNSLLKFKINNIYTTNIDNLIFSIYENSQKYYINDTSVRGDDNNTYSINYHPLHGSVCNPEKGFIFSNIKIATAYADQLDSWQGLRRTVSRQPIVFWGWSFNDSDIIEAIYKSKEKDVHDNIQKWIVLHNPQDYEIYFYKSLNFNIIYNDTKSFLEYLDNIQIDNLSVTSLDKEDGIPKEWLIPKIGSQPSFPIKNFFEGDAPRWSYIFSPDLAKLHYFKEIYDAIIGGQNIIIKGIPASGKTTILMQLAYELNTLKLKTFLPSATYESAKKYLNTIKNKHVILFLDNCLDDYTATSLLLSSHVQIVGCDRDNKYENLAFRLRDSNVSFRIFDISEINDFDMRGIVASIPKEMIKKFPSKAADKTIFDLLRSHINIPVLEKRFAEMVEQSLKTDPIPTELFVMICYAHSCGIPVSFDMIYSYCHDITDDYREMYDYISKIGRMIKECCGDSFGFLGDINFEEQDYYQCRTRYIAEIIINKIRNYGLLRHVIVRFVKNIPSFKICRYDIFKRRAFDADLMTKIFPYPQDGIDFYTSCTSIDDAPFLYQQAALYLSRKRRYKEAFTWIEYAKNNSSKNIFSIKNTHAIILFNANIDSLYRDEYSVLSTLHESLDIIEDCYKNDRRKSYHARVFGELVLKLYKIYGFEVSEKYLVKAYEWLDVERLNPDHCYNTRQDIKRFYMELKEVLNY